MSSPGNGDQNNVSKMVADQAQKEMAMKSLTEKAVSMLESLAQVDAINDRPDYRGLPRLKLKDNLSSEQQEELEKMVFQSKVVPKSSKLQVGADRLVTKAKELERYRERYPLSGVVSKAVEKVFKKTEGSLEDATGIKVGTKSTKRCL